IEESCDAFVRSRASQKGSPLRRLLRRRGARCLDRHELESSFDRAHATKVATSRFSFRIYRRSDRGQDRILFLCQVLPLRTFLGSHPMPPSRPPGYLAALRLFLRGSLAVLSKDFAIELATR